MMRSSPKSYMASLLAALAVIGGFQQGFRNIIPQVALAVLTAVIFDMLLRYFIRKETVIMIGAKIMSPNKIALSKKETPLIA